jgi:hypothetical protein
MNDDTEILFPFRVIPSLRSLRGESWKNLIDQLCMPDVDERDRVGFSLMMVRLGGCGGCNADSFRAMRGCTHCARLTIRRFKNSDEELLELFTQARSEVVESLERYKENT